MSRSSCDEIKALLFEYLDDRLSDKDREKVEEHLRDCAGCKKEYEQDRTLRGLIKDSAFRPKRDLSAAVREAAAAEKPRRFRWKIRYTALSTAAAALVIVTAVFLAQKMPFMKYGSMADSASGAPAEIMYASEYALSSRPEEAAYGDGVMETAAETAAAAAAAVPPVYASGMADAIGEAEELEECVEEEAPAAQPTSAAESPEARLSAKAAAKNAGLNDLPRSLLEQYAPDQADTAAYLYVIAPSEKEAAAFAAENGRLLAEDDTCWAYLWEGDAAEVSRRLTDGGDWQEYTQEIPSGTPPCVVIIVKK